MSDNPSQFRSEHDMMIDEVIFKRDLDEVHLLLDHVSGQTDKSLDSLRIADDSDPTGQKRLSTRAIVERVARIRYPPTGETPVRNAGDAAFLIVVKDQLNGLAQPARGLTVAYTSMFVGVGGRAGFPWRLLTGGKAPQLNPQRDPAGRRANLAREIYPGLVPHARLFRAWFALLVVIVLPVWLFFTVLTYWDSAFGRAIMQRFDRIQREHSTLVQANPTLARSDVCTGTPQPELGVACERLAGLRTATQSARADLDRFRHCGDPSPTRWLHVMRWGSLICGPGEKRESEEQMVSTVLGVYGTYILPMMFGVLGTMIAVIRKIQDHVGRSELHPRDFLLAQLLIPMGAVAAVAVGLFYSPSGTAPSGSVGLSGDLTLTAGGIGFLAGYGSPAFFTMLDGLLKQVFRLEKPAPKDQPAAPA